MIWFDSDYVQWLTLVEKCEAKRQQTWTQPMSLYRLDSGKLSGLLVETSKSEACHKTQFHISIPVIRGAAREKPDHLARPSKDSMISWKIFNGFWWFTYKTKTTSCPLKDRYLYVVIFSCFPTTLPSKLIPRVHGMLPWHLSCKLLRQLAVI